MNIKIGKYVIKQADKYNITISEIGTVQNIESENYGKETEKVLGYYSKLEHALSNMLDILIGEDITSIEECIESVRKAREDIIEAVSRL